MMMPKAHIPRGVLFRVCKSVRRKVPTSECKCELEERHCCSPTGAEAVVHNLNVRVAATELGVDYDKTDSPVRHGAQNHKEH